MNEGRKMGAVDLYIGCDIELSEARDPRRGPPGARRYRLVWYVWRWRAWGSRVRNKVILLWNLAICCDVAFEQDQVANHFLVGKELRAKKGEKNWAGWIPKSEGGKLQFGVFRSTQAMVAMGCAKVGTMG